VKALCAALELLGYSTIYHMKHVKINGHTTKWVEAIRARFDGEGEKYGREEFDDFLSNYGVSAYTFTAYGVLMT